MLGLIRNYRFDPFAASTSFQVISNEYHAIPGSGTYWVRLKEVPDEAYTEPTSGTPVYVRTSGGTPFTEVSGSPGLNEFRVDYTYKSGWVQFNSGNAGNVILVNYRGTGSPITAELLNALQMFQPATVYFGGDGSDGAGNITTDTALSEDPAGGGMAFKQYTTLEIATTKTLSLGSGVHGAVIAVQGLCKLGNSAVIDVSGKGGAGGAGGGVGVLGSPGGAGGYGAGGGGYGYTSTPEYKAGGDGGSAPGAGAGAGSSGRGATVSGAGGAGSNLVVGADEMQWRSLLAQAVYGAGGGGGGGGDHAGGAGGAGGGFLVINCGVLEVGTAPSFDASAVDGSAGGSTSGGGGGGGAGGTIVIIAQRIVGSTAATIQSTYCDVTAGAAGAGNLSAGGAGAAGYKRVIELYSHNLY